MIFATGEANMSSGTVLVLEDSRVQAQYISRMLTSLNWSAVLSFDHKMVYAQLKASRVDLMLLDVYVDSGNTLTLLPEIRELAHGVPIAIMTAGGQAGRRSIPRSTWPGALRRISCCQNRSGQRTCPLSSMRLAGCVARQ
jgi:DNA-binding NtrC family response regulator